MRFPEFEGEWGKSVLEKESIINPKTPQLQDEFIYIDLESVIKGKLTNKKHVSKSEAPSRAQRVLSKQDILFQCVRPYQLNNYIHKESNNEQWVASTGYAQIRTTSNDTNFLYQLLNTPKFNQDVLLRCTGSSYPAISSSDLGKISISVCSLEEQRKIGYFLSLLDKRIATQNKIIEDLKILKSTISEELFNKVLRFNKHGEDTYPEWEKQKLGSFMSIPDKIQAFPIDKNKLLTVKLHLKGVMKNDSTESLSINGTTYYARKKKQFIYGKQNLFNGAFGIIPDKYDGFLSSNDVPTLDVNHDKINHLFLIYYMGRRNYYMPLESLAIGSGSKRIHETTLLNLEIAIPTLEEQASIVSVIHSIERKINIEVSTLQNFNSQKKYLLSNLFV